MAYLIAGARRREPLAVEAREDDGDVVRPSRLVRTIDQPLARRNEIVFLGDDACDLVLSYLAGETIAAEDKDVAATHSLVGEVDLDHRLGAEGLEDDVAALALGRL